MKKRKIQSGKSADQKLNHLMATVDGLTGKIDGLTKNVDVLTKNVDGLTGDVNELKKNTVTNHRFETVIRLFREDFDELKDYVHENLVTKKEFAERINDFRDSLLEMREHRDSRLLFQGQHVDLQDTVAKHEKRIAILEKKSA